MFDATERAGAAPQGGAPAGDAASGLPEPASADPQPAAPRRGSLRSAHDVGEVRISEEVVGVIAGIAASEVEGVAGMAGGLVGGISDLLGKRNPSRGVKVEVGERQAAIDVYIVVEYGVRIPKVAQKVQEAVKQAVESMTGLEVVEVNVHVQGVSFPGERPQEARVR